MHNTVEHNWSVVGRNFVIFIRPILLCSLVEWATSSGQHFHVPCFGSLELTSFRNHNQNKSKPDSFNLDPDRIFCPEEKLQSSNLRNNTKENVLFRTTRPQH